MPSIATIISYILAIFMVISSISAQPAILYDQSFQGLSSTLDDAFRGVPDPYNEISTRLQQIHSVADYTPVDVNSLQFLLTQLQQVAPGQKTDQAISNFQKEIQNAIDGKPVNTPSPTPGASASNSAPSATGTAATNTLNPSQTANPTASNSASASAATGTNASQTSVNPTDSVSRTGAGLSTTTTVKTLTPVTAPFAPNSQGSGAEKVAGALGAAFVAVFVGIIVV
ncbi:hypothetical protein HDU97_006190 [Phlyctochytrium planicorne]|nr:hypothetical protein HDU97_006190 [Phlyctochytrium planicorne]